MRFSSFAPYLSLVLLTCKRPQILEESPFTLGAEGIDGYEDDDMQIIMEPLYFRIINLRKKVFCLQLRVTGHGGFCYISSNGSP